MIKAVIFDLDGVIIDSEPLWWKAVDIQLAKHGIELKYDNNYRQFVNKYVRGRGQKYAIKKYKQKFKLKGSYQKLLAERLKILLRLFEKNLKPIKGTIAFIKKLDKRHIPLAVASSSPPGIIRYALKKYKLDKFFRYKISGENLKYSKPHPEIFLVAAKKLKISPKSILVIEDSVSGIKAAKKAGMKCIALKQPYNSLKDLELADKISRDLSKLKINEIISL